MLGFLFLSSQKYQKVTKEVQKTKKIIATLLALCVLFSMSVCVSAKEKDAPELKMGQIAAGAYHSVWIQPDGSVSTTNSAATTIDVSSWQKITKVAAHHQTLGLREDGKVFLVDGTERNHRYNGALTQYTVSTWSDIVDIDASECNIAGVTSSGTVVVAGSNSYKQCSVSKWTDIVDVELGMRNTYGLKSNGTVVVAGDNYNNLSSVAGWRNIVAISAGAHHIVGLKADGTVVAAGMGLEGQCDVSFWTDIVAIAAGGNHTVALRSDGTVVATGDNGAMQCNVGGWTDIVAIDAGIFHTLAMKADGTLVAVGGNEHCQCCVG